ncbi:MAG: hypothetical protein LC740_15875 [Actinobacteria bacterium]|nr:hypothetical protein [Actinomycetota bacterium]
MRGGKSDVSISLGGRAMAGAAAKLSINTASTTPVRTLLFIVGFFIMFDLLFGSLCGRPCDLLLKEYWSSEAQK